MNAMIEAQAEPKVWGQRLATIDAHQVLPGQAHTRAGPNSNQEGPLARRQGPCQPDRLHRALCDGLCAAASGCCLDGAGDTRGRRQSGQVGPEMR